MKEIKGPQAKSLAMLKFLLLALAGLTIGGMIGLIAGSFMYAQHYLVQFFWETIPEHLGKLPAFYILGMTILGGLVVGLGRKYLGDEPQPMHTVIHNIRTGEGTPGIQTVPKAYLLSALSLGFGAALGPEAALVGISVGFSSWVSQQLAALAKKLHLEEMKNPWAKIPGYLAIAGGVVVFSQVAKSIFSANYPYYPYDFSFSLEEIVFAIVMGLLGILLGKLFIELGGLFGKWLSPIKEKPVLTSIVGGAVLGILGIVSPLILFSGQTGLRTLFDTGLETGGFFLILIGLLKIVATKANSSTGWKGGEFFPLMFSSMAIGLGIANLVPGIDPMVALSAITAASVTVVMGNVFLALLTVLLFLPADLILPMGIAALLAFLATKRWNAKPKLVPQEEA